MKSMEASTFEFDVRRAEVPSDNMNWPDGIISAIVAAAFFKDTNLGEICSIFAWFLDGTIETLVISQNC